MIQCLYQHSKLSRSTFNGKRIRWIVTLVFQTSPKCLFKIYAILYVLELGSDHQGVDNKLIQFVSGTYKCLHVQHPTSMCNSVLFTVNLGDHPLPISVQTEERYLLLTQTHHLFTIYL